MTRYVEISETDMRNMLETEMGFKQVFKDGTTELLFERPVEKKTGEVYNYSVRVYSSITPYDGKSRGVGEDAIRVVLMDNTSGYPVKIKGESKKQSAGSRIYRTKNALPNLRERCREYFKYVFSHACPSETCENGLMIKRKGSYGEFYGCNQYPTCTEKRPVVGG